MTLTLKHTADGSAHLVSPAKPPHIQVAEVLGWKPDRDGAWWISPDFPVFPLVASEKVPPRYDTDWSATGPLIEKYGLQVGQEHESHVWVARDNPYQEHAGEGGDPLMAVCNLLIALGKAGKL